MMKIHLLIIGTMLLSCGQKRNEDVVKHNIPVRVDSFVSDKSIEKSDSYSDPNSSDYLNDLTPKQFAELLLNDSIEPSDNNSTFRVMDSLDAQSYEDRRFFFKVFLKIMRKADGALAEAVGEPAMKYTEKHTVEFLEFASGINKDDFQSWANQVGAEICLSSNSNPQKDEEDYYIVLKNNCKGCSEDQFKMLEKYHKIVKQSIIGINNQ